MKVLSKKETMTLLFTTWALLTSKEEPHSLQP